MIHLLNAMDNDVGGPGQPLLTVRGLRKHFPLKKGFFSRRGDQVRAVDGIDFSVHKGETLGLVGESGCGKSTTARLLMQLIAPTAGEVVFDGRKVGGRDLPRKDYRRQVQRVFQDSYASLNPRLTVEDSIAFGPMVHGLSRREALTRAHDLLDRVGLAPTRFAGRYPHELSGGQRQRVNIGRALALALALQPRLLILDEAVSALDKSVEAQVLNLLMDLKRDFGLTNLFISHDLQVVRYLNDRVMVIYLGQVAELGPAEALFAASLHPYTRALLGSARRRRWTRTTALKLRRWPATRRTRSTRPAAAVFTRVVHWRQPSAASACPARCRPARRMQRPAWCRSRAAAIRWHRRRRWRHDGRSPGRPAGLAGHF